MRVRVLLVEDEDLIRNMMAERFSEEGLDVVQAATAEDALALPPESYDILFTDIRMPGSVDGWQLAERLREIRPELPVVYSTGWSDVEPRQVARSAFVRKPYTPSRVLEAISALAA